MTLPKLQNVGVYERPYAGANIVEVCGERYVLLEYAAQAVGWDEKDLAAAIGRIQAEVARHTVAAASEIQRRAMKGERK